MFTEILDFLENYRWVFDFRWTEISSSDQINKLPSHWIKFFENVKFEEIKKLVLCDFVRYFIRNVVFNYL